MPAQHTLGLCITLIEMKYTPGSLAMALATQVFPQPGGPFSNRLSLTPEPLLRTAVGEQWAA